MPITFSCANPECKAKLTVPDEHAGKKGKCPKCKGPIVVPGAAPAAPPPAPKAAAKSAPEPKPAPPKQKVAALTTPAVPPEPPPAPVDADALAMDALADAPEEKKVAQFIEFDCPMCSEKLKFPVSEGGKRTPCPECRRIILVPMPAVEQRDDWRNTGPKQPEWANREGPKELEGAWGVNQKTMLSDEAAEEAGLITEPEKPLTFYQKYQMAFLVGIPLVLLLGGGYYAWDVMFHNAEARALRAALTAVEAKDAATVVGPEGMAAVQAAAANYHIRSQLPGCASKAREHFAKAVTIAGQAKSPALDAFLAEVAVDQLQLGGGPELIDTDRKIAWAEVQKLLRATINAASAQPARIMALKQLVGALDGYKESGRIVPLTLQAFPDMNADRADALGVVGLELLRTGKTAEADAVFGSLEKLYADKERPTLRPAAVALYTALGKEVPKQKGKDDLDEKEMTAIGKAEGLARAGKVEEARKQNANAAGGGLLRLRVALAIGSVETKQPDAEADLAAALEAVGSGGVRQDLSWPLVRLVRFGLASGVASEKLEPAVAMIADPSLRAWAAGLVVRSRIAAGKLSADVVEVVPAETLGGLVARMELAKKNAAANSSWGSTVNGWKEPAKSAGSVGVALGMQGK